MFPPHGPVVQLVRTLACHARGQGFESPSGRQYKRLTERSIFYVRFASVAQLVEQGTENPRVVGSIPIGGTIFRGFSSFGRARPCQGRGGGFEPRNPLHIFWHHSQVVRQRSAKPLRPGSNPGGASKERSNPTGLLFSFFGGDTLFRIVLCTPKVWQNPVHIPRSKIDKLACQAQSVCIFAAGEYPGGF